MSLISHKPIKLVKYSEEGWEVNAQAIPILLSLKKPIKVLAVAGRYRSGKSHILNKFLSVDRGGFELGHKVEGCTKGIWMWGRDTGNEITLALDTEGLNDTKNDPTFDAKLFSLALLLSSYLVLNIPSVLDEQVINQLSFVADLSKIIFSEKTTEEEDDGTKYKELFPPVMFLLRDFLLSLDGQPAEDYLAETLKQQPGRTEAIKKKNDIRDSITQAFPVRDIMSIPPPHVDPKVIQNIQEHESELSEAFRTGVDDVCSALRSKLKIKRAKYNGPAVDIKDGEAYLALTKAVVEGLNKNGKIEIPSLLEAVYESERRKNVELGAERLSNEFNKIASKLPRDETELVGELQSAQSDVVQLISERAINAETMAQITDELTEMGIQMQENILAENKEASRSLCKEIKTALVEEIRKLCTELAFNTVDAFTEKKQESVKLLQTKGVGPALKEVLQEFDNDCAHITEILYTQLKLQKVEIEAAETARKQEESQRQLEQIKKEADEAAKQNKIREEALKAQNDAFAKKIDEDMRRWKEEKEEMKKHFEQEIAQAKKVNDTKLLEIAQQQYKSYSKRNQGSGEAGQIYVRPYTKKNGTKVDGYWRRR